MNDESTPKGAPESATTAHMVTTGTDFAQEARSRPRRIKMTRRHPWRPDHPDAVIVARGYRWGNPFTVDDHGLDAAVRLHREWVLADPAMIAEVVAQLRGRDLACWCKPDELCHADTLIAIANDGGAR